MKGPEARGARRQEEELKVGMDPGRQMCKGRGRRGCVTIASKKEGVGYCSGIRTPHLSWN